MRASHARVRKVSGQPATVMLALLTLCTSPVTAQAGFQPSAGAPMRGARAYIGEVSCDAENRPVPALPPADSTTRHGIARAETIRHEAAHVGQLLADCRGTLELWRRNPVARLDAEVQATCIGISPVVYADTAQRSRRRNDARVALSMLYGVAVSFGQIYEAFERWCER